MVRAGVFADRDATLAQGATATVSATLDVDGDGRDDELLVVTPPSPPEESTSNPALVLARHVANGWTSEVVERNNDVVTTFEWRAPLRLGGVVFLVVESVEVDREEHTSTLAVTLLRARSPRGVEPVHEIRDANARSLTLSAVGERAALVTRSPHPLPAPHVGWHPLRGLSLGSPSPDAPALTCLHRRGCSITSPPNTAAPCGLLRPSRFHHPQHRCW